MAPRSGMGVYNRASEKAGAGSREVAPGVALDFDVVGRLVGIDIDHAGQIVKFPHIEAKMPPVEQLSPASSAALIQCGSPANTGVPRCSCF